MNTTQIQCFLRVADSHSFTKAASALYLTQQSVSRQIALLEEELDVQLLDRTTPYITLTQAGQVYYNAFSTAGRELTLLKEDLSDYIHRQNHCFRVGISLWLNPFGELGDAIAQFQENHPATSLELTELDNEDLSEYLQSGKLDAAFFSGGQCPHSRELRNRVIARGELRLFAPRDAMEDSSPEAIDSCWNLPMLMVPAWEYSFLERRLVGDQEQAEFKLHPSKVLSLPNLHSLEAALHFGRCTTVGDYRFGVFNHIPELGSLPLPLEENLLLVWPGSREHPLLEEFSREMEEELK